VIGVACTACGDRIDGVELGADLVWRCTCGALRVAGDVAPGSLMSVVGGEGSIIVRDGAALAREPRAGAVATPGNSATTSPAPPAAAGDELATLRADVDGIRKDLDEALETIGLIHQKETDTRDRTLRAIESAASSLAKIATSNEAASQAATALIERTASTPDEPPPPPPDMPRIGRPR